MYGVLVGTESRWGVCECLVSVVRFEILDAEFYMWEDLLKKSIDLLVCKR